MMLQALATSQGGRVGRRPASNSALQACTSDTDPGILNMPSSCKSVAVIPQTQWYVHFSLLVR